jgi:hypothetical protein
MVSLPFPGSFASATILEAQTFIAADRWAVRLASALAMSLAAFPSRLDDGWGKFKTCSHTVDSNTALACGTMAACLLVTSFDIPFMRGIALSVGAGPS